MQIVAHMRRDLARVVSACQVVETVHHRDGLGIQVTALLPRCNNPGLHPVGWWHSEYRTAQVAA
jgi:hypothetical protein